MKKIHSVSGFSENAAKPTGFEYEIKGFQAQKRPDHSDSMQRINHGWGMLGGGQARRNGAAGGLFVFFRGNRLCIPCVRLSGVELY